MENNNVANNTNSEIKIQKSNLGNQNSVIQICNMNSANTNLANTNW